MEFFGVEDFVVGFEGYVFEVVFICLESCLDDFLFDVVKWFVILVVVVIVEVEIY